MSPDVPDSGSSVISDGRLPPHKGMTPERHPKDLTRHAPDFQTRKALYLHGLDPADALADCTAND